MKLQIRTKRWARQEDGQTEVSSKRTGGLAFEFSARKEVAMDPFVPFLRLLLSQW